MIPFAELTIGTAIRPSRERLRTVADGCERLRTVAQRLANTAQPPHPQSEMGTQALATHSGKQVTHMLFFRAKHLNSGAAPGIHLCDGLVPT